MPEAAWRSAPPIPRPSQTFLSLLGILVVQGEKIKLEVLTKVAGCYPKVSGSKLSAREQEKRWPWVTGGFEGSPRGPRAHVRGHTAGAVCPTGYAWFLLVIHTFA